MSAQANGDAVMSSDADASVIATAGGDVIIRLGAPPQSMGMMSEGMETEMSMESQTPDTFGETGVDPTSSDRGYDEQIGAIQQELAVMGVDSELEEN